MKSLSEAFPPPDELLKLEPEEIAVFLLDYLCDLERNKQRGMLSRYNFTLSSHIGPYAGGNKTDEVAKVITEGWMWLEKEGMLAPRPGESVGDWIFVTRKGYRLREQANLQDYKQGYLLPKDNLDENLLRTVYPLFVRGDYDTAVFRAYKEIEVRVRTKAGLPDSLYGTDLMRTAFNVQNGKLTDMSLVASERQAMSDLFAGCIGLFKNPLSHREVDLDKSSEVAEIIMFANYLLRIVERCKVNK